MKNVLWLALACVVGVGCVGPQEPDGAGGSGGGAILTGVGGSGGAPWTPPDPCPPGEVRLCWCPQGYTSTQVCNDDGVTIGACDCSAECVSDADCDGTLCEPATCIGGACVVTPLPLGTVVLTDPPGDCAVLRCVEEPLMTGHVIADWCEDIADVPDDGNECTFDGCGPGGPMHTMAPTGSPCVNGICNGEGACMPVLP